MSEPHSFVLSDELNAMYGLSQAGISNPMVAMVKKSPRLIYN